MTDGRGVAIGILGGMGPAATADLFRKVVAAVKAANDQGHPRIVVECDPSIPDRNAHLEGKGADPLPALMEAGRRLVAAGVDVCALASVSAHAYLPALRAGLPLRFVSVFEELAGALPRLYPTAKRLGALTTTGVMKAGLFDACLPDLRVHYPDEEAQARFVMEAIYGPNGIKSGNQGEGPRLLLRQAAHRLTARGADVIVMGSSEVPLAMKPDDASAPLVDPMQLLADALALIARTGRHED